MGGLRGRGSAIRPFWVLCIAIITILTLSESAFGAIYTVGGKGGWTYNVSNWPKSKLFKAGDVLAFNYRKGMHNVVAVEGKGYTGCKKTAGAKGYQTGLDRVKLRKGHNYFICSLPGHCQAGMKIHVYAL